MEATTPDRYIDARPERSFFISMLVKDIQLRDAIADLVDNCIDGAKRYKGEGQYSGLTVDIEADNDHFKITDNCGGIDINTARHYAFRFGRPEDMQAVERSVGQFGVGMKRALFKLGSHFFIESRTATEHFTVDIDVEQWKSRSEDDWHFEFATLEPNAPHAPEHERGTSILVDRLLPDVAEAMGMPFFANNLLSQLSAGNRQALQGGLTIKVNGTEAQFTPAQLLNSPLVNPAYRVRVFQAEEQAPVTVRMFAGLAPRNPADRDQDATGWYIYCNGRQVLGADRSLTTGWGDSRGTRIPRYHGQFAPFRGYVYFDSIDTKLLPWNTTKNSVDADSRIFRSVREDMIDMMRPVIDAINAMDQEIDREDKPITEAVDNAEAIPIEQVDTAGKFSVHVSRQRGPRVGNIQYKRPLDQIERLKEILGARSNGQVGEETFDYVYREEVQD